jgi:hypothetical protein
MADDTSSDDMVPRGLALLRAHWPIAERTLVDGTSAAVLRCPVARIILEPGGPQESGTIWTCAFGFRPDGTPAFARIEAAAAAAVHDAALLAAMEEKADGRPVMSTGLRLTGLQPLSPGWFGVEDFWRESIYYDDLTLRDSFAQWLRQQLGDAMSEEAAQRAAMLHLAAPPLRERLDRFEAGPAKRLLDAANWYNGRAWLALNGTDNRGTPTLALCEAWPIFADAIIRHVMRFSFPPGPSLGATHVAEAIVTSSRASYEVRRLGLFFRPGEPAPAALVHAIERMRGLEIDVFAPFPAKSITTEYETLFFVACLPEAWCPRERSDWVRVAQVASSMIILIESYGASAAVLAQSYAGHWADWVDRVLRAPRQTGLTLLGTGMIDVGAACQAFSQQLVGPLLARARRAAQSEDVLPSKEVYRINGSTLFAELPAEAVFARAADWHAQSERIEAELATLPAATALHVDRAVLAARRSQGSLDARCGYDAANDVNIAVALRLWQTLLPERLRGLPLNAFAAALGIPNDSALN